MKYDKNSPEYKISQSLLDGFTPDGFYDSDINDTEKAIIQIYKTHGELHAVKFYKEMSSDSLTESRKQVNDILIKEGLIKETTQINKTSLEDKGNAIQKSGCSMIFIGIGLIIIVILLLSIL